MNNLLLILIVFSSSFILTELVRRFTLAIKLIDIPNERSSHDLPVPRGGGLSIVIVFLLSISLAIDLSDTTLFAIIGSGVLIAVVGIWDDYKHIHAKWRLLAHFAAAFWVLYWLGGIDEINVLNLSVNPGIPGLIFIALVLVWLLNLFNFMDGIDGIAASEVIFVSSAGAYFTWLHGQESIAITSLILAASTTGFLLLNWPPAKIFMGDVGSSFLGFILGIIAYITITEGFSFWVWIILLAVFLVDSGITLLRRILNGDRWYEAHCSHAYQHAARKWGHKKVTMGVTVINLIWLFPLAVLAHLNLIYAMWITLLAFLPLIITALKFNAGVK